MFSQFTTSCSYNFSLLLLTFLNNLLALVIHFPFLIFILVGTIHPLFSLVDLNQQPTHHLREAVELEAEVVLVGIVKEE